MCTSMINYLLSNYHHMLQGLGIDYAHSNLIGLLYLYCFWVFWTSFSSAFYHFYIFNSFVSFVKHFDGVTVVAYLNGISVWCDTLIIVKFFEKCSVPSWWYYPFFHQSMCILPFTHAFYLCSLVTFTQTFFVNTQTSLHITVGTPIMV